MLKVGDKVRVVNYVNDEADGEDPNGVTGAIMKRGGGSGLFTVFPKQRMIPNPGYLPLPAARLFHRVLLYSGQRKGEQL